jgi:hypothetical protein
MKAPTQCIFWTKPKLVQGPKTERFELVETYADESHWSRCLLKCRECGQLYFYEFYEIIDWEDGEDPQYWTYIPVESEAEIETLKKTSPIELLEFLPRLRIDFPKGAKVPSVGWVR